MGNPGILPPADDGAASLAAAHDQAHAAWAAVPAAWDAAHAAWVGAGLNLAVVIVALGSIFLQRKLEDMAQEDKAMHANMFVLTNVLSMVDFAVATKSAVAGRSEEDFPVYTPAFMFKGYARVFEAALHTGLLGPSVSNVNGFMAANAAMIADELEGTAKYSNRTTSGADIRNRIDKFMVEMDFQLQQVGVLFCSIEGSRAGKQAKSRMRRTTANAEGLEQLFDRLRGFANTPAKPAQA